MYTIIFCLVHAVGVLATMVFAFLCDRLFEHRSEAPTQN